jgi:hypothetical protein
MKEVPGHVGWRGKVRLKCGNGRKLLWGAHLVRRARSWWEGLAPGEKGALLVRRARPYGLFLGQGAQAPIDYLIGRGFGDFLLFFDAAKS